MSIYKREQVEMFGYKGDKRHSYTTSVVYENQAMEIKFV